MIHRIASRFAPHALSLVISAVSALSLGGCVNVLDVKDPGDNAPVFVAEGDDLLDSFAKDDADVDNGYRLTHVIAVNAPFSRIGLRFDAQGPVAIEARVSDDGGATLSGWQPATVTFNEGAANNAFVDTVTAGATHLQLRFLAPVESQLTYLAVDAFDADNDKDAAALSAGAEEQALSGDLVQPRSAWGARSRNCTATHSPSKVTIHHTETPNNDNMSVAARIRQIQSYHIDVRGWCDIGYHFLIAKDGTIYQGRNETIVGAHVANNNTDNVGISFIGNYQSTEPPAAMLRSASRLLDALHRAYGVTLDRTHVKTHREQGQTDCPGNLLHAHINDIINAAVSTTPPPPPPPPSQPAPSTCTQVTISGADTLNVRPTASTQRSPVATVSRGDVLDVTSVEEDGAAVNGTTVWYGVNVDDNDGFVSGAYARCTATSTPTEPTPTEPAPEEPAPEEPAPVVVEVYDGIDRGGAPIPRAGLANATLRGALGVSTEPYGSLFQYEGHDYVRGRVSHFGGPNDTGVSSTETGAVSGERLRSLNDPMNASAATIASRPEDFYFVAMRWDYGPRGRSFWQTARVLVVNPANGKKVVLRPVDWGPNTNTRRVLDISPQAIRDLGATTDDNLLVAFARDGADLGVVP